MVFDKSTSNLDIKDKVNYISRNYLEREKSISPMTLEESDELIFYRVKGLTDFWIHYDLKDFNSILADIINSISKFGMTFSYILMSDKNKISLLLGVSKPAAASLEASLNASYPYIDLEPYETFQILNELKNISSVGGIITGNPTDKTVGETPNFQVERLIKGLFGHNWAYILVAKALSPTQTFLSHQKILSELNEISKTLKQSVTGGTFGNQVIESEDFFSKNYLENVGILEEKLKQGISRGMWRVCPYYVADDDFTNDKLKNLLKSIFSGEDSKPESIRCIDINGISNIINELNFVSDIASDAENHPVGIWIENNGFKVDCFKYKYQSILNSNDVATLCQIPRQEVPGYYINHFVEFEVAERRSNGNFVIGNIINGNKLIDNKYNMDLDDLTRHGLIIGITGGGKTNTSKSLLSTLWNEHNKPFLAIESAKREYWELANLDGFKDLYLFTLGSEGKDSIPYRINPFEVIGDVSLQTHIDYLLSTFKASFELYPPMPYVLETCVYEVYEDRGWDVLRGINTLGRNDFPTLEDLYYKVEIVTDRLGYHNEIQSNVKAALQARINSLRVGGKGAMLDTDKSIPFDILLNIPAVMELEDIGDDEVKAFVIGIVMVQLYEYRRSMLGKTKGLEHLLIIEEAHRLLKNVSSGGGEDANPRAKAVEFFCNLLAEIRSYGQGILIADQIPTKLASDTLKNTNLKIVHRTVMEEDRQAVGKSMNMTDEQIEHLSALNRGCAAVYSEGDNRPKLVKMPLVKNKYDFTRTQVIEKIKKVIEQDIGEYSIKYNKLSSCSYCRNKCNSYSIIEKCLNDNKLASEDFDRFSSVLKEYNFSENALKSCLSYVEDTWNIKMSLHEKLCLLGYILNYSDLTLAQQKEVIIKYIKMEGIC